MPSVSFSAGLLADCILADLLDRPETQVRDLSDVDMHLRGEGVDAVQLPKTSKRGERGQRRQEQTSTSPLSELSASGLLQRIPLEDIEQQASWQAGRPYPEIFLGASDRKMGLADCGQWGEPVRRQAGLLVMC